jgi:hypothetical protein
MPSPTPRQQAGYLRRLMRRGEIELIDPATGRAAPAMIEIHGDVIRIVPMFESPKVEVGVTDVPFADDGPAFASVVARLRNALTLEQLEEFAAAVETEAGRARDIDPPV